MIRLFLIFFSVLLFSCKGLRPLPEVPPHIVFVMGDEEYRSEESMPMIASLVKRELGAKISLCFALDSIGFVDPNRLNHIDNLQALETADLVVMFTRFRSLPDHELQYIQNYVAKGKPLVGFRTSTHAFLYKDDKSKETMNNEWPSKIFGQQWITHHGHFEDGGNPLTSVTLNTTNSKILNGIKPFDAYSWLYHVDGGEWKLNGYCTKLLTGKALKSNHANNNELHKFPIENPVAWTKTYTSESGNSGRVFFTTLGHPYDFKNENMRRLAVQGIYWALGKEALIPKTGVNVSLVSPYEPNNSGFGQKFKKEVKGRRVI